MKSLADANLEALILLFSGDSGLWTIIGISFSVSLQAVLISAPVALVVADIVPMVVSEERADLQRGAVRRPRNAPAGPIDDSPAAQSRIRDWLGIPALD